MIWATLWSGVAPITRLTTRTFHAYALYYFLTACGFGACSPEIRGTGGAGVARAGGPLDHLPSSEGISAKLLEQLDGVMAERATMLAELDGEPVAGDS